MADNSKIEWTDATWNPITGCSVKSPGCKNCYAMRLAGTRMKHHWSRKGLTDDTKAGPVFNGKVRLNEPWIEQPLRWKRPRMIFVCAHGDLFHEHVPDKWIDQIWNVMYQADSHTFQVLTKRPERMREWVIANAWPAPHIWLGTSVEDQKRADERIPDLLDTPAAVRWVSAEPLLGPVDLFNVGSPLPHRFAGSNALERGSLRATGAPQGLSENRLDWVVAGGESGPGARPMHPDWARSLRDQCAAAGVPYFVKQLSGPRGRAVKDITVFPEDLQIREWPHAR